MTAGYFCEYVSLQLYILRVAVKPRISMYFVSMECLPICKLVSLMYLKKLIFDIKMEMHANFLTVILSGKFPVPLCLYCYDTLTVVVVEQQTDTLDCTACPACCCVVALSTASGSVRAGTGLLLSSALTTPGRSLRGK